MKKGVSFFTFQQVGSAGAEEKKRIRGPLRWNAESGGARSRGEHCIKRGVRRIGETEKVQTTMRKV